MYRTVLIAMTFPLIHSDINAMDWKNSIKKNIQAVRNQQAHSAILNQPIQRSQNTPPLSPLRLAIQCDYALMKEMLELGANPNDSDEYGNVYECAGSLTAINALVQYGANFKNSKEGRPLSSIFDHYSCLQAHMRNSRASAIAAEEMSCLEMAIKAGADVNQYWNNTHPIEEIIARKGVSNTDKKAIIALLLKNGCNPHKRLTQWKSIPLYTYYRQQDNPDKQIWYSFLKQEQRLYRYSKARQFLIACYKEKDSPFALLPLELVHMIGRLIMQD